MEDRQKSARKQGFTLVEQAMATAIVAVLACVAAPAVGQLVARNRLQVAQSDLMVALQQTRALALQTGRVTMLCPSRDGRQCSDDVRWETGWLIGPGRGDHFDQLIGTPIHVGGGHERVNIVSTVGRRRIRFQPGGTAGGSNASFTICPAGEAEGALVVRISNTGRILGAKASQAQALRCAQGG
ncbi:GspH/FimT family pseudopilin [Dyella sp. EPa41]|uniref:GspH/FimT family pseudopilin n=1 Tax=Dyella sp. EPa41 TaxID=1561194 RepID=UPI001916AA64|nr:GspH/FimT family pseudopilin [Dyella sp. EPa41]